MRAATRRWASGFSPWVQARGSGEVAQVLGAYLGRSEDGDEGHAARGFFHGGASLRLLALHQTHDAHNLKVKFSGGLDGLHGGGSRGADVIDDDHARAFLAEALDALPGAVALLGFADEEAVNPLLGGGGGRGGGAQVRFLGAEHGDGDDDGVGPHGESSDGLGTPVAAVDFIEKDAAGEARAFGVQGGGAAVDVVVAGAAAGELELAQAKGLLRKKSEKLLARVRHGDHHSKRRTEGASARAGIDCAEVWPARQTRATAAAIACRGGRHCLPTFVSKCTTQMWATRRVTLCCRTQALGFSGQKDW